MKNESGGQLGDESAEGREILEGALCQVKIDIPGVGTKVAWVSAEKAEAEVARKRKFFQTLWENFSMVEGHKSLNEDEEGEFWPDELEWKAFIEALAYLQQFLSPGKICLESNIHAFWDEKPPHQFAETFARVAPFFLRIGFG